MLLYHHTVFHLNIYETSFTKLLNLFSNKSFLCWVKVPAPSCNLSLTDNQRHLSYVTWILASKHSDVNNTQDNFFVEKKKTEFIESGVTLDAVSMPCVVGGAGKGLLAGHVSDPARGEPLEGGHDRVTSPTSCHVNSIQASTTHSTHSSSHHCCRALVSCRRWHEWLWSASCQRRWQSSLKLRPWNESQCLSVRISALCCVNAHCSYQFIKKQSSRASV